VLRQLDVVDPLLEDLDFDELAFPVYGVKEDEFDVLLLQVSGLLLFGGRAFRLVVGPGVLDFEELQSAVRMVADLLQEEVQELFGVCGVLEDEGTPDEVLQEHVGALPLHVVLEGGVRELLPEFGQAAFQQLAGRVGELHALHVVLLESGGRDGGRVAGEDFTLADCAPQFDALLPSDELVENLLKRPVRGLLDAVRTRKAVMHRPGVHREPRHG